MPNTENQEPVSLSGTVFSYFDFWRENKMTAKQLQNKYSNLWNKIYWDMVYELQMDMDRADIEQYKSGNKKCRLLTIAHNAAFIGCSTLDELLAKKSK